MGKIAAQAHLSAWARMFWCNVETAERCHENVILHQSQDSLIV
jgi:hypothetical protein